MFKAALIVVVSLFYLNTIIEVQVGVSGPIIDLIIEANCLHKYLASQSRELREIAVQLFHSPADVLK